ncbi:UNVERIFIED_CONTAM: hypothetical protein Scaly_1654700 [Sesamum calycinum]|uniref:DUF4218 domain-containing protein n=1 Tax=Sesamum calycinum TaxID=2727403 RepID=A0AAW2NS86_9LAMI
MAEIVFPKRHEVIFDICMKGFMEGYYNYTAGLDLKCVAGHSVASASGVGTSIGLLGQRHVFRWRKSKSSLWSEYLHGRYCRNLHPTIVPYNRNHSPVWHRLCRIRDVAEPFLFWTKGEGSVSFWHDNWLGEKPLAQLLHRDTYTMEPVSYYWHEGDWNVPGLFGLSPCLLQRPFAKFLLHQRNAAKYRGVLFSTDDIILEVQRHLYTLYAARTMMSTQWKGDLRRAAVMGFIFRQIVPRPPSILLVADIQHVFREANGAADHLVKEAASLQLTRVLYHNDITGVLRGILCLDRRGAPHLRWGSVDIVNLRLHGMKSHDCHVFMQKLIPIAFRELLPEFVWSALTEVSILFQVLCSTTLDVKKVQELEENVTIIMCNLEKIFPPAFFDLMEHLIIHLPYEACVGGLVQYRWMYTFERSLRDLKKKVKNKAHVEASICEAYIVQEIRWLTSHYFESHVTCKRHNPGRNDELTQNNDRVARNIFNHQGRISGVSTKRYALGQERNVMETYVLCNSEVVVPYYQWIPNCRTLRMIFSKVFIVVLTNL